MIAGTGAVMSLKTSHSKQRIEETCFLTLHGRYAFRNTNSRNVCGVAWRGVGEVRDAYFR
ncbi:hypothetical protein E2C01_096897 [Portunus trituberculatus]|uniref:Uncharacterized protein n=1 Tax=Portunus trituberculatus TaxID=210409 RepID=A0A5B7K442_PORTR|nr:hypothetical protein [Portunus trituberculatus]